GCIDQESGVGSQYPVVSDDRMRLAGGPDSGPGAAGPGPFRIAAPGAAAPVPSVVPLTTDHWGGAVIPADTLVRAPRAAETDLRTLTAELMEEEARLRRGGGPEAIARQHAQGRKTARERIDALLDPGSPALELGLWAGYQIYDQWGGAPGA